MEYDGGGVNSTVYVTKRVDLKSGICVEKTKGGILDGMQVFAGYSGIPLIVLHYCCW